MSKFSLRGMLGGLPAAIVIASRLKQKKAGATDDELIRAMAIAMAWVIHQRARP